MANLILTKNTIEVHGRGSVVIPYKVRNPDGTQIDISSWTLFFEIDGVPIREQLTNDPQDPLGKLIKLERAQVETLSRSPLNFALVDETLASQGIFTVLWDGTIRYTGYRGSPDTVGE
jgi:hypothetical protein